MLENHYWQLLKARDKDGFDYFYNQYFGPLSGFGKQFTQQEYIVQDCIQELFIHLWNTGEKLPDVYYIRAYLYKSLKNRIISFVKKETLRKEKVDKNSEHDYYLNFSLSHEYLLISRELDEEARAKLQRAIRTLTAHQREAIFLRFYENMEYEEIAATLSLKDIKYARTLIYRSLEALRDGLKLARSKDSEHREATDKGCSNISNHH